MTSLIPQLHEQQRAIQDRLQAVERAGLESTSAQGVLTEAFKLLIAHVNTLSSEIYPVLRESRVSASVADRYADEMCAILTLANEFYAHYRSDWSDAVRLAVDFSRLRRVLGERFRRETQYLYAHYETLLGERRAIA